ncbi:MAG: GGDEF domain-containing protein [Burkholderiales bacterium]|nr:GGDEF domain-containing protein [Burkholderiales bacterium]
MNEGRAHPQGRRIGWLLPQEPRQALRMRRFLMAAGTALTALALAFVLALLGFADLAVARDLAVYMAATIVVFYVLFRTGLNQRFRDPSLTAEQIAVWIAGVAFVAWRLGQLSAAVAMFYFVVLMFGVLRLPAPRLLALALTAVAAHGAALWAWHAQHPQRDAAGSLIEMAVLAFALPWFALMGGYVSRLRRDLAEANRRLQDALGRLEAVAVRDELTGIYNRRFLMEFLEREAARARRTGSSYALCLCDIDHFKRINDTFGHAAGDAVLRHFALVAQDAGLRAVDVFGRLGGEEFLIVLPDTDTAGATACAERVRAALAASPVPGLPPELRVTVTIGVARALPHETPQQALARADRALYEGKGAGRDRVVVALT